MREIVVLQLHIGRAVFPRLGLGIIRVGDMRGMDGFGQLILHFKEHTQRPPHFVNRPFAVVQRGDAARAGRRPAAAAGGGLHDIANGAELDDAAAALREERVVERERALAEDGGGAVRHRRGDGVERRRLCDGVRRVHEPCLREIGRTKFSKFKTHGAASCIIWKTMD